MKMKSVTRRNYSEVTLKFLMVMQTDKHTYTQTRKKIPLDSNPQQMFHQ